MPDLDAPGCWRLAVAVLRQAVKDVADARLPAHDREGARLFPQGAGLLTLWTGLLGLPPDLVTRRYPLAPGQPKPPPQSVPVPSAAADRAAADAWFEEALQQVDAERAVQRARRSQVARERWAARKAREASGARRVGALRDE